MFLFAGCAASSQLDSDNAGRTLVYTPGVPNFDLEVISTWRDEQVGLDIYLGIPHISLIFLQQGEQFRSIFETVVELQDEDGKEVLSEIAWVDTLLVDSYAETQDFEPWIAQRRFDVEPGTYIVNVQLRDLVSQQVAVRRQRLQVFERQESQTALSRIRLEGKRETEYDPLVAFHVPNHIDSLRSVVELYNMVPNDTVQVQMVLLRFLSDTLRATPPYWIAPPPQSLAYRGIDYRQRDTVQVSSRLLTNLSEEVEIEFKMPPLERGNYRVEILALRNNVLKTTQENRYLLTQTRDLSIKADNFPSLSSFDQMIQTLTYIAREKEISYIFSTPTAAEKKRRFDAFWGNLVRNKQRAKNLVKRYYSRVEEANLFFTSHKEGWKTDRGMIYVVLGSPQWVERQPDGEIWHYSYGDNDPLSSIYFQKVRHRENQSAFNNYILIRRTYFERAWTRAIERWRTGNVL